MASKLSTTFALCGLISLYVLANVKAMEPLPQETIIKGPEQEDLGPKELDSEFERLVSSINNPQVKLCFQDQRGVFHALSHILVGDAKASIAAASGVPDPSLRSELLREIANQVSWEEDPSVIEPLTNMLERLTVDARSSPNTTQKFWTMFNLGKARVYLTSRRIKVSDFNDARDVALRHQDRVQRDRALHEIVDTLLRAQSTQGILEIIGYISDPFMKTHTFIQLAKAENQLGHHENSDEARKKALANLTSIPSSPHPKEGIWQDMLLFRRSFRQRQWTRH